MVVALATVDLKAQHTSGSTKMGLLRKPANLTKPRTALLARPHARLAGGSMMPAKQ
jgi:hypothetical protein